MRVNMAMGRNLKFTLGFLVLTAGICVWQGIYYLFHHNYSSGHRTGVVRKVSVKGPPYCKYLAGEMVLQGSAPGQPIEVWEFTVADKDEPAVKPLIDDAERSGKPVTLEYRQDLKMWWRCTPIEYFVTGVVK